MDDAIVYRCRKCGKLAYPHQILLADEEPPRGDCGCYTGPRWERGIWMKAPELIDGSVGNQRSHISTSEEA